MLNFNQDVIIRRLNQIANNFAVIYTQSSTKDVL